jgi:hypothetical protein
MVASSKGVRDLFIFSFVNKGEGDCPDSSKFEEALNLRIDGGPCARKAIGII